MSAGGKEQYTEIVLHVTEYSQNNLLISRVMTVYFAANSHILDLQLLFGAYLLTIQSSDETVSFMVLLKGSAVGWNIFLFSSLLENFFIRYLLSVV